MGMVSAAAALFAAAFLGSCAGGGEGAAGAGISSGHDAHAREESVPETFDPPHTALEIELAEDLADAAGGRAAAHEERRVETRFSIEGVEGEEGARDREYVSIDGGRFRLRVRRKGSGDVGAVSGYGAVRAPGGSLAAHAGCFVPDLDGGLVAGGGRSPYVFSSGFPLEEPRGIAPATSFYGTSIAGGAVEARFGRFRAAALAGRELDVREDRPVPTGRRWAGGRVESRLGAARAAAWALAAPGDAAPPVYGAGVRSSAGNARFRAEWAWRRGAPPGALAAAAFRSSSTRAGAIAYALPAGAGGPFSRVCSSDLAAAAAHSGGAAAIERRMPLRFAARAAIEWRARSEPDAEGTRVRLRAQVEKRWRGGGLTVEGSLTREEESPLEPFPSDEGPAREALRSLGASARVSLPGGLDLRATARILAREPGAQGTLLSSSARLEGFSRTFRATIFHSLYAASPGAPSCYACEPSLSMAYPWRCLARGISRCGFVIVIEFNELELSHKVVWEESEALEWGAQARCSF